MGLRAAGARPFLFTTGHVHTFSVMKRACMSHGQSPGGRSPAPWESRLASPQVSLLKGSVSPHLSTPGRPEEGVPSGAERELAREAEVTYPAHPACPAPAWQTAQRGASSRPAQVTRHPGAQGTQTRGWRILPGRPDKTRVGFVGHCLWSSHRLRRAAPTRPEAILGRRRPSAREAAHQPLTPCPCRLPPLLMPHPLFPSSPPTPRCC